MNKDETVWYVEGPGVEQYQEQIKNITGEEPVIFKIVYFRSSEEIAESVVKMTGRTVVKSKKNWEKVLGISNR